MGHKDGHSNKRSSNMCSWDFWRIICKEVPSPKKFKNTHMAKKQHKRLRHKTRFWIISTAIIILMFIAVPLAALTYISDSYALVEETATADTNSAAKAKKTAKQLYKDLMQPTSTQVSELTLSENEINGIIALAMRGIKGLKGRVNVTPIGIKSAFTFHVPKNPFGDYINLTATIIPSPKGLIINDVSIGSFEISGTLALSIAETLLNQLLNDNKLGSQLIKSVESIEVNSSELHLVYRPVMGLKQAIDETRGQVKGMRNDLALLGDPEVVKLYYQTLCTFHKQISGFSNASLAYYLSSAFTFAETRTFANGNPKEENRAALLALAIFLGSASFDSVVGAIDEETFKRCPTESNSIVLADRNDLRLHFIFSAALKTISNSSLSFAIGEFKELLDSQQGGSGFSFADLAADRAGIRFAELALSDTGSLHIQQMASELTEETLFFPSITALPEGIPQQTFEEHGGIESEYYKKHLATINSRIDALVLYQ